MCLGMLYPIMEVFRNDDEFAEELSTWFYLLFLHNHNHGCWTDTRRLFAVSMEPPLPIYFFQMLANLKDRSTKSFPAKKVCPCWIAPGGSLTRFQLLLVTWKSVLACLGGQTELTRVKTVARELAGLSPLKQDGKDVSHSSLLPDIWFSGRKVDAHRHASFPTGDIRQVPHIYPSRRTGCPLDETSGSVGTYSCSTSLQPSRR